MHIERVPAPEAVPDGMWYIMHRVDMHLNHVGTHIETPYHVRPDGKDVATVPLSSLCGEAVVLDLTSVPGGGVVSLEDVQSAAERVGGIRRGDIVLARFDYDDARRIDRNFAAEAIAYLVDAGMKMMGVDLPGIELPRTDPRAISQHNHHRSCWITTSASSSAWQTSQLCTSRVFLSLPRRCPSAAWTACPSV